MTRYFAVGVICLAVGVVAGFWWHEFSASPGVEPKAILRPPPKAEPAANRARVEEPVVSAPVAKPAAPTGGDSLELLRRLQSMRGVLSFSVRSFDINGHISTQLKTLFHISDAEETQLNAALDEAKRRRGAIEAGMATSRRDEKSGALIITLPTYPEQGGQIYDQLLSQIQQTLGADRAELFQGVCGQEFDRTYGEIGLQPHTYTVTRATDGQGQTGFEVKDEHATNPYVDAQGQARYGGSGWSQSRYANRSDLVKQLGALGEKLIPPDF